MNESQNLVAVVTGARGGIGAQVVARLRTAGHRVAAVGRDAASLAEVAADAHLALDVTTPEGAAAAIEACESQLGAEPALLAHCVGSTLISPLHRTSVEQYRELMRVNLDSAAYVMKAWVEAMRSAGGTGFTHACDITTDGCKPPSLIAILDSIDPRSAATNVTWPSQTSS